MGKRRSAPNILSVIGSRVARRILKLTGGKVGLWVALVCGALATLCIGVGVSNLRTAERSQHWPNTSGEIIHAEVEEHTRVVEDDNGRHRTTSPTYESNVVYVYRVKGEEYRGERVRFNVELNRAEAEATVDRYPVGASVSVYYDAEDPAEAVLEPGGDVSFYKVLIGLGFFFIAVAAVYFAGRALVLRYLPGFRVKIDENAAGRVEQAKGWRSKWAACNTPQKISIVLFGPVLIAAFLGWMALGFSLLHSGIDGYLHPDGAQKWPEINGLVVASEMKRILVKRSGEGGLGATYHRFDLRVEVEYRVLANRYTLEKEFGIIDDEAAARAMVARYAKGTYVPVSYNPRDPADTVLGQHEPAGIGSAVIGGLLVAPWLLTGLGFFLQWFRRRYGFSSRSSGAA